MMKEHHHGRGVVETNSLAGPGNVPHPLRTGPDEQLKVGVFQSD